MHGIDLPLEVNPFESATIPINNKKVIYFPFDDFLSLVGSSISFLPILELNMSAGLRLEVKKFYKGRYAITEINSLWGIMMSSQGIKGVYIFAKSLFKW